MVRLRPLPVADEGSNKNCVAVKILSRRIERAQKFWVTARRRLEPTLPKQQVPDGNRALVNAQKWRHQAVFCTSLVCII